MLPAGFETTIATGERP